MAPYIEGIANFSKSVWQALFLMTMSTVYGFVPHLGEQCRKGSALPKQQQEQEIRVWDLIT